MPLFIVDIARWDGGTNLWPERQCRGRDDRGCRVLRQCGDVLQSGRFQQFLVWYDIGDNHNTSSGYRQNDKKVIPHNHTMFRKLSAFGFFMLGIAILSFLCFYLKEQSPHNDASSYEKKISITVGLYIGRSLENAEVLHNADEILQYHLDTVYLGEGNDGASKLLDKLVRINATVDIQILNPATTWVGDMGHPPGLRHENYKYPLVRNVDLRSRIKKEVDRIRGWSDKTEPILPWIE